MAKLKQFSITHYYRGIELTLNCVTSSKKKFAELFGSTVSDISKYAYCFEPRDKECIASPDVIYATIGLGGEGRYVFDRDMLIPLSEFKVLIDKHRETYENYRDFLKKTGRE